MKTLKLTFFVLLFFSTVLKAQVAVNPSGSSPDPSALLDLSASDKGLLIPRLSTAERAGIIDPAKGLIVLDTTRMAFYYYDGMERWIQVATGSVNYDTISGQVVFDQNILFSDSVEIYDDLKVPVNALKIQGANNQPLWSAIGSVNGTLASFHFGPDVMQQLFFVVQVPHGYMPGSALYPHIHWMPATSDAGAVVWGLEYTWASIGSTFDNTVSVTGTGVVNNSEQNMHKMTHVGSGIDGTGETESSMLICRMYRDGGDAADTFPGDAVLLEVDFHYRVEKIGEEFSVGP